MRRRLAAALVAAAAALAGLVGWALVRGESADLPWTPLDLGRPVGAFTGRKLAALTNEGGRCRALLRQAGVRYRPLPRVDAGACGYDDAVALTAGGARAIRLAPAEPPLACPVAAALALWEWDVVQPAARTLLHAPVVRIDHYGSYSCRRIAGTRGWSEHARADAIDIAGFVLADGRRITVARDWRGTGADARFLHAARDGACRLFATTLSPDYNAAHADHLHLDQAPRGALGWRACR